MKSILVSLILAAGLLAPGCASTSSVTTAVTNPANIAKAAQDIVAIATTAFLARNPSYAAEVTAAGDVLVTIANGNPATFTGADIKAALANTSISSTHQAEFSTYVTAALGIFQADFNVQFPGLTVNYALFFDAVANGFYIATGHATVVLPVVTVPTPSATAI